MTETYLSVAPTSGKPHWYTLTPAKFLLAVLVMQGVLFLSVRYRWFWFNERKGYTVLITVAATLVAMLLLGATFVVSRFLKAKSQFTLGNLMLMIPVMAIPCAWMAREMERARQQRDLVAWADFDSPYPTRVPNNWFTKTFGADFFLDVTHFGLSGDSITDSDLLKLKGLTHLQSLSLKRTRVTEAGLAHLTGLRHLQELSLRGTHVNEAGLAHLGKLPQLHELWLDGTQVTDAGLEHLKGLTQLQTLSLSWTQVTDGGMKHLKSLEMLKKLYLDHTEVTDTGLEHLKGLAHLQTLDISETRVTDAGLTSLHESLPNCDVRFMLRPTIY